MSPFDEIVVEEAICLKEADKAEEIIVVSIGIKRSRETLRKALRWAQIARSSWWLR